ncbi:15369_t:CDS:2, partial [Gigaspora rosea]
MQNMLSSLYVYKEAASNLLKFFKRNQQGAVLGHRIAWQQRKEKITVMGDAGIGKSRLLMELQQNSSICKVQKCKKHHFLNPNVIFKRIARSGIKRLSDLTVYLLLDGVHRQIENSDDTNLIITSESFIIGCCSATSMMPMRDILAKSRQLRIQLPAPQLKALNQTPREILDGVMGGNGRALEAFKQVIVVLVTSFISTDLCPDQSAEMGLVRFEAEKNSAFGRLTCLHVWLLLITCAVNDPILLNWGFDDYDEIQHFHNPEKVSLGAQLWQNFERFASDFQVLKSGIYNKKVKLFIHTIHSTASIIHENGINKKTSTGQERNITEVLQIKKLDCKTNILFNTYLEEGNTAADISDIFLVIITGKTQIDASQLPARSGIIHQNNWKEYLGPFSGRVFIYANVIPSDINTSSRCWLSGIDGIGRKYADIIIKKRPYQSLEVYHQKTGIALKFLSGVT